MITTLALVLLMASLARAQTEQTLYTFTGSPNDGNGPLTGLIQDAKGNFYGATSNGGATGAGTVYKLTHTKSGKWKETILYNFLNNGVDGAYPEEPLLAMDKHGAIYGTTARGGTGFAGPGTVFKLTPGKPQWKETILYDFTGGSDGGQPIGGVTVDSKGNLYGTTFIGGDSTNCPSGCGVVYELAPGKKRTWTYSVLHTFTGIPGQYQCEVYDGRNPGRVTLVLDSTGNIYGATTTGGYGCSNFGTIFELSPQGGGNWNYSVIYAFGVNGAGYPFATPNSGVILDSQGNLYGVDSSSNVAEFVKAQGYAAQILYQPVNCGVQGQICPSGAYDTVTMDKSGNLFWTTASGPIPTENEVVGGVYELSPSGQLTVLYAFSPSPPYPAGKQPWAPVVIDSSGNLYGTTTTGGATGKCSPCDGTAWEITP